MVAALRKQARIDSRHRRFSRTDRVHLSVGKGKSFL